MRKTISKLYDALYETVSSSKPYLHLTIFCPFHFGGYCFGFYSGAFKVWQTRFADQIPLCQFFKIKLYCNTAVLMCVFILWMAAFVPPEHTDSIQTLFSQVLFQKCLLTLV